MLSKRILQPSEVGELVPHWFELEEGKLARIATLQTRPVTLRNHYHGDHIKADVLDVPPIVICPSSTFSRKDFLLNGKHRGVVSIVHDIPLLAVHIETRKDLLHCLPQKCLGDLSLERLIDCFIRRDYFERICAGRSITSMLDLVSQQQIKIFQQITTAILGDVERV